MDSHKILKDSLKLTQDFHKILKDPLKSLKDFVEILNEFSSTFYGFP